MKKIFLILSLLLSVCVFAFAQESMNLKQTIEFALVHNPTITQAKQMLKSASYNTSAAKGAYLPRIDVVGSVVRLDEPVSLDLNNIRAAIIGASGAAYSAASAGADSSQFEAGLNSKLPSFEMEVLEETITRVTATIVQPIFMGFKLSANAKVKKLEEEVSQINYQNTRNKVITSVTEDYYRVQLAIKVIDIRKSYKDDVSNHAKDAQILFDNGIISKSNLLRAQVALANANKDYQNSSMDKELALTVLSSSLGSSAENFKFPDPMTMLNGQKDFNYYLSAALANNVSLKLLNKKKQMLEQKHKVSQGALLPNIALMGEYQLLQNELTALEPEWLVGVNATLNIFSGGSQYNEIRSSKAELVAVDAQIKDTQNLITSLVKKLYQQCEIAKNDFSVLDSTLELAQENLKFSKAAFQAGSATSLEVLDAEIVLTKIKVDQAKAIFDYNSAFINLLNVCNLLDNF